MTVPDHAKSVADRYVQGVRWATAGITLVVLYGLELAKLLGNWHRYQAPAAQVAALVVLSAIPLVAWREEGCAAGGGRSSRSRSPRHSRAR
ncbi:hypothetical protein GCM10029964_015530 [Kibdelosporangium lantanae]